MPVANAGYTVIEDDLFPTSAAPSNRFDLRSAELSRAEPNLMPVRTGDEQRYSIPFAKYRSPLTAAGRAKLDELIPAMKGARVRVVGRFDAMAYTSGKLEMLAYNRANMIRAYLMKNGIPASDITMEVDANPNPQPNGTTYPSDLYISRADRYANQSSEASSYALPSKYQTAPQQQVSASGNDARTIQYINQAVQSGQMSPAVAVKLIQYIMDSKPGNAVLARPAVYQPTTQVRPEVSAQPWTLDKALTLRENIDAWSKLAGWQPSQWDASNAYQVTVTTTLDGAFPDVLRQIADATGLNICAKKREKYVRVTDSTVSCK
ncbi:MAG TPA: TcpQ domain-containing protein [Noviherbaspirillum sp.]|nr:TcpQ domain-containing protein [Noviherbaspirillum sp.]